MLFLFVLASYSGKAIGVCNFFFFFFNFIIIKCNLLVW
jgi:hypothetical protein